jgi:FkbM family methyltransferase
VPIRPVFERWLYQALNLITTGHAGPEASSGLYQTRILRGPNRQLLFSVPQLERLSFALGSYEPHVIQIITRYLRPGLTAYDVGANAGYFTLLMARLVTAAGRVIAFEPDPKNLRTLNLNVSQNHLTNVTVVPKAVSAATGSVEFATFGYSLVGHIATAATPADARLVKVDAITLDEYVFGQGHPAPDLIKIDVEGAEHQVMAGAERVFQTARPVIIAEVRAGQPYEIVLAQLTALNYRMEHLSGGWQMSEDHLGDLLFLPNPS